MDEGWTRWILEQNKFPFTNLYNPDVRGGHLRDRFDAIILPDMGQRTILDGHRAGTIPPAGSAKKARRSCANS